MFTVEVVSFVSSVSEVKFVSWCCRLLRLICFIHCEAHYACERQKPAQFELSCQAEKYQTATALPS